MNVVGEPKFCSPLSEDPGERKEQGGHGPEPWEGENEMEDREDRHGGKEASVHADGSQPATHK